MSSSRKRPYQIRGMRWRFGSEKRTRTFSVFENARSEAQVWANETGHEVTIINKRQGLVMETIQPDPKHLAYQRGLEAVRMKPQYAPDNPYDEEIEKELYEQWDCGADDAGICDIYENGELLARYR